MKSSDDLFHGSQVTTYNGWTEEQRRTKQGHTLHQNNHTSKVMITTRVVVIHLISTESHKIQGFFISQIIHHESQKIAWYER